MRRTVLPLVLALALAAQGCTYLGDRLRDAAQMADIGITVSEKPEFAAYACAFGLMSGGYGHINGKLLGLAGGRIGAVPLKNKVWGLGPVGREDLSIADAEEQRRCTGAICIVRRTPEGMVKSTSCCHYLHLGFIGLAGNLHYKEMLDFLLGFVGVDISGDDRRTALREKPARAEAGALAPSTPGEQ